MRRAISVFAVIAAVIVAALVILRIVDRCSRNEDNWQRQTRGF